MTTSIEYYFTSISPFAFMGHDTLMEIAKRHGKEVDFKPFNLASVWEISGAVVPAQRPPMRQRYRMIELQRVAEFRKLPLNPEPAHFPTNPALADHCIIAIVEAGKDPASFARAVGEAVWINNLQIASEDVISELLAKSGYDANVILAAANDEKTADIRAANSQAAIKADAVGAPAYVYKGEVFWGQDRLEYLNQMLTTGRAAYKA